MFGCLIAVIFLMPGGWLSDGYLILLYGVIATSLYPYSRLFYERLLGFFVGDNVFIFPIIVAIIIKFLTMSICWFFSPAISLIGIVCLIYADTNKSL